jgi:signal transduction histidine kinase/CheY-like chemotaxis protein
VASTAIDTAAPSKAAPFEHARRIFVKLLVGGAVIMAVIGYTDYRQGLSTTLDLVMLPMLCCVTLTSAWIMTRSPHLMKPVLAFNALMLAIYYEGIFLQSVIARDAVSGYSLASIAQFLPGFYIALFVFLSRRAVLASWLLYLTLALQCLYGLAFNQGPVHNAMKEQLYIAILTAHPCCILVLTFMNHLRRMVEEARHESLAAKERFLAIVSHEVRSPLQTIVASLDLVDKTTPAPILDRAIVRLKGAAGVLEAQIRDLTAFTKLELSNDLYPEPVDLARLAATLEQIHQEAAQAKGLRWRVERPDEPLWVQVDPSRLRQIIDNLVSNALKYTARGEIVASVAAMPDGMVRWQVRDTGRGIPPDKLTQVFEPFVRIKAAPQEKIEGSGLGLAVVRQLVGLMHGRIHIDSVEDLGTTVNIHLPLPAAQETPRADTPPAPRSALVVDDDPDILDAITDLLAQWGVQDIDTATDGKAAMLALHNRAYDLVLLDLQLPLISGYGVALAARVSGHNDRTPLVAMSAMALDRREAGAGAFNASLRKPVSRAMLVQTLAQVLR